MKAKRKVSHHERHFRVKSHAVRAGAVKGGSAETEKAQVRSGPRPSS